MASSGRTPGSGTRDSSSYRYDPFGRRIAENVSAREAARLSWAS